MARQPILLTSRRSLLLLLLTTAAGHRGAGASAAGYQQQHAVGLRSARQRLLQQPPTVAATTATAEMAPPPVRPFSFDGLAARLEQLANGPPPLPPSGQEAGRQLVQRAESRAVAAASPVEASRCDCDERSSVVGGQSPQELAMSASGRPGHYSLLSRRQRRGASGTVGCACPNHGLAAQGPPVEGGTGLWMHICELYAPDLRTWGLVKAAHLPQGIVVPQTLAYVDSCDMCATFYLNCRQKEEELVEGNCLCMWREFGADPLFTQMPCSSCVEDCAGSYKLFDIGTSEPAQQRGMCVMKQPH